MAIRLVELARAGTDLDADTLRHLQRIVTSWQPLADLCFSDLLLLAPARAGDGRLVVLAQVRPTTGQTLYPADLVGTVLAAGARPVAADALRSGQAVDGEATVLGADERCRVRAIPIRCGEEVVAVLARETATTSGRRQGELERRYLEVFDRFAVMVADGSFPFAGDDAEVDDAPRVGDGVIVLDDEHRVRFASPNAVSALHRLGIHANTRGRQLVDVGFSQDAVESAGRLRQPVAEEIVRGETAVVIRALPLLERGHAVGAVVLLRDVTDLRRRDRLLLSKDATIREIHHRVKNNLQTIAALLRLQRRRVESPEALQAIEESERRIRSIAIVHETLSRNTTDAVRFVEIAELLVRQVEETVASEDVHVAFEVRGDAGVVPGDLATPLAVVLNELVQNAVEHGFPVGERGRVDGTVVVSFTRGDDELLVEVCDDGVGLATGFSLDESRGLGLSIVQALVTTELGGSMSMTRAAGTRVDLRVPLPRS